MALFAPFSCLLFFVLFFQYGDSAPCLPGSLARYFWSNQHVLVGETDNPLGRIHCTWNWFLGGATTCPYYPRSDNGGTDLSNLAFETTPTGTWACAGPNGQNSCWYTSEVVSGPDAATGMYTTTDGTQTDYRQIFSGTMGTDGQCNGIASDCASADTWACEPGYMPKDLLYPYSDYQTCKEAFCDRSTYKLACCAKECTTGYYSQVGNQCPAGTYGGAYAKACKESTCTATDESRCCVETTSCLPDDGVEVFGTPDAQNGNFQNVVIGNTVQGRVLCEWSNRNEPPMECPYYKVGETTVDSMVNCAIEGGIGPRYCWSNTFIVDGPHQSGIYNTGQSVEREWFKLFKQTPIGYTACHRPDNDCSWQEYSCSEAKSPVAWLLPDESGGPGYFSCQARYCKQESFAAGCCATTTNTSTTTNKTATITSTTTNQTTHPTSNTTTLAIITFTTTNTTSSTSTNTSLTTNTTRQLMAILSSTNATTTSNITAATSPAEIKRTNTTTTLNTTITHRASSTPTTNTTTTIITTTSASSYNTTINVTLARTTILSSVVLNTTRTTNATSVPSMARKPTNTTTTVNLSGSIASWRRTENATLSSNSTIEAMSSSVHASESNTTSSTNETGVTASMAQKANTTSLVNATTTNHPTMALTPNATSSVNETTNILLPTTLSTNKTSGTTTSTTNITATNTTAITKSLSSIESSNLSTSTNTTTIVTTSITTTNTSTSTTTTTTNTTTTYNTSTTTSTTSTPLPQPQPQPQVVTVGPTSTSTAPVVTTTTTTTTTTIISSTTTTNTTNTTLGTSYVDSYAWWLNFTLSNESETGETDNAVGAIGALEPHTPNSGQTGQTVVSAQIIVVSGRVSVHIEWDGPNALVFAADARVRTALRGAIATMAGVTVAQVDILRVEVNR